MNILFKNIRAINPDENFDEIVNIWIKDGIIEYIGKEENKLDSNTEIVESNNLIVSPGFFDMNATVGEPGFEYKEDLKSISEAALNGGFTDILIMPNTEPVIDNATVIEYIKTKSENLDVNIHISGALTQKLEGNHISEMLEMSDHGALLFTNDLNPIQNSDVLKRAFDYIAPYDLLIATHCEDKSLTHNASMNESELSFRLGLKGNPKIAEEIEVIRNIKIADYSGNRRLHLQHITTEGSIEFIRQAKINGLRVSCEVSPQHFILDENVVSSYNSNYKMNPPLRQSNDINSIIDAIKEGIVDVIVSDHKASALHEKDVEYELAPNGIINLETAVGLSLNTLLHKHNIELQKLIELFAINPRKILNLDVPSIKAGQKAVLTFIDPNEEWVVDINKFKSKSTNTPFNNYVLKGKPKFVINNNKFIKSTL